MKHKHEWVFIEKTKAYVSPGYEDNEIKIESELHLPTYEWACHCGKIKVNTSEQGE